ncbi:MAG: SbcC/MukB-like Walker B domain-containing protein, partial [Jiangellaceae bacterium]
AQAHAARAETRRLAAEVEQLGNAKERSIRREATAVSQVESATARAEDASTRLGGHLSTWRAVAGLDGVLAAALGSPRADSSEPELTAEELAALRAVGPSLRSGDRALLRRVRTATGAVRPADVNTLLRAFDEAKTGAAADHEPTRVQDPEADVFVLYARDESAPLPLGEALGRLRAAAAAQEAALSERQRQVFEDHLLGMLGDQLRQRRREARELVERMNEELTSVRSSQGIGVRLQWALKEDASPTVQRAAELLNEPIGRLLPEARRELLDGLMELVESVRAQQRELGYAEHLKTALDYRSWSAFRIMVRRGADDDHEVRLTRRTALSQGEQKVVSYLPLFAAAAAHFDAVGEGAPHAPRFVLLDDAFPKIDAQTHPRLFGLLVALDLDWVMTSERLTGMYDTVPEQSIYEASRRPGIRGILQYQFRWRGRRLEAVPEADGDESLLLDPGRMP